MKKPNSTAAWLFILNLLRGVERRLHTPRPVSPQIRPCRPPFPKPLFAGMPVAADREKHGHLWKTRNRTKRQKKRNHKPGNHSTTRFGVAFVFLLRLPIRPCLNHSTFFLQLAAVPFCLLYVPQPFWRRRLRKSTGFSPFRAARVASHMRNSLDFPINNVVVTNSIGNGPFR